jgi:hypothetical protein
LIAFALLVPALLSFPLGLLAAAIGSIVIVGIERLIGPSIRFESIQPALLAAFVLVVGYYQWFTLLPRITGWGRSRAR